MKIKEITENIMNRIREINREEKAIAIKLMIENTPKNQVELSHELHILRIERSKLDEMIGIINA